MTPRIRSWAIVLFTVLTLAAVHASDQTVRFDAPGFIEGREIDDAEFQTLHTNERLVEFSWEIAANFGVADLNGVTALSFRLHTLQPDVTIVDYCPRTLLESNIEGPIEVEKVDESNASLGISLNSGNSLPLNLGANAGVGGKNSQSLRYHQRPAQQLLISSGLEDRGLGLFVKLRRSSQFPLEGTHPIRVTLRLPRQWRTGFLRLDCEAIARKDSRLGESIYQSLGKRRFLIPILIGGDEEARLKARAIQQAEGALRASVLAEAGRGKSDRWMQELSSWGQQENSTRLDAQWLDRVITASPTSALSMRENLPKDVAISLKDFSRRKLAFVALGHPTPVAAAIPVRSNDPPTSPQ
jgi:hypothetical protein